MGLRRIRIDMHTHSEFSTDSSTTIQDQARAIRAAGLDVVCATDHNTIEGALRLREHANGFRVVIGEEIATREGEVIGLFLEHPIPPELTAEETIERIHNQGGAVSIPHPFSRTRPSRLRREALDRLWPLVDCIETFNAREVFRQDNKLAEAYARERAIPGAAGSDAHRAADVGRAWIEVDDFVDATELVAALSRGIIHGRGRLHAARHALIPYYKELRSWGRRRGN